MRVIFLIAFFILFSNCHVESIDGDSNFEEYELSTVCELPDEAYESSGIVFFDGLLWTINDSGNDPVLYGIDTNGGVLKREVRVNNADNHDWEALAQDDNYIYIADNGNNAGQRPVFSVYQISKDSLKSTEIDAVTPKIVVNYWFNKDDLESIDLNGNTVDSEAILVSGDSIFIYTKEWTSDSTSVFSVPKNNALSLGSLGGRAYVGFALTAACFTEDNTIAFLGYKNYHSYLTIVRSNPNLLGGVELLASFELEELQGYQTEAITYENGQLFISCENLSIDQSLFRLTFN